MSTVFSLLQYAGLAIAAFVFLAIIGFVGLKFYTLASKERAFVRTGAGNQLVVLTGGAFVIPSLHEIIKVNMKTLRLDVDKNGKESLITKDRLRVDVKVEFYVRVKADEKSVADAAQTLGELTMNPDALKEQVEAKFVDALRAVAVKMDMYELNAQRADFVQQVQQVVSADIAKNGLELESVSLTSLNQAKKDVFDPNNAFDAEGLLVLTRETQARLKLVNDIEKQTAVDIETRNLDAERQQQSLRKQTEEVKLATNQEIATLTANQEAAIASTQAVARQRAETATIEANRDIEAARITSDRDLKNSRIAANQATEEADVRAKAAVTMRGQEQNILVAEKATDEANAKAIADEARAKAVTAEESVATSRAVEIANRQKAVTLVQAEEKAGEAATAVTVAAKAEMEAATHRAAALRTEAEGKSDAAKLNAQGIVAEGEAQAKALGLRNEAQNTLSPEQVAMQLRAALIEALPKIIAESVKPLERIDSIRIAEVGGLGQAHGNGHGNGGTVHTAGGPGAAGTPGGANLADQVVDSALRYRVGAPVIDTLMREVGLPGSNLTQMLSGAALAMSAPSVQPPVATDTPIGDGDGLSGDKG